ncbi:hypothetical protein CPB83DRAFT_906497 [Crepidotus variabilis]|uniref:RanBD1 domain-containing protein n=1 Tax=Crepidotus variabilis TaxID=179855 RepID=A0A9P6EHK3_9AGAR|nr:hypothetical protein CPB83DRAFT_906497 [Crepidotus variabilis]
MMPITDFNFVVAGIATFAATVGYACTRRQVTGPSGLSPDEIRNALESEFIAADKPSQREPSPKLDTAMSETSVALAQVAVDGGSTMTNLSRSTSPKKESLKRKIPHDGFDEPEKPLKIQQELGYPHNLANIYPPNKRSRTPSTEAEVNAPSPTPTIQPETEVIEEPLVIATQDPESLLEVTTPAPEPPRTPTPPPEQQSFVLPPALPSVFAAPQPAPQVAQQVPVTPKSVAFRSFASPSSGFAAFAGSASPFASVSKPQQSAFKPGRSIWNTAPSNLVTHPNEAIAEDGTLDDPFNSASPSFALEETKPLASPSVAKNARQYHPLALPPIEESKSVDESILTRNVTGEEEEEVEMELKNVKLYIKRGNKNFGEGIPGHLKLLSHRTTLEERLLFRREPLWKVSMNVRVQSTARCLFVPEENALKLILKEDVNTSKPVAELSKDSEPKQELVIYALKPGRACSKQDFREFAETLVQSSHFNPTAGSAAQV